MTKLPSFSGAESISEATRDKLKSLVYSHVESFNYFLSSGLGDALLDIPPFEFKIDDSLYVRMFFQEFTIGYPGKSDGMSDNRLTPREARERGMSYSGVLLVSAKVELPDGTELAIAVRCGDLPIMVMSERCHLHGLKGNSLVKLKEECNECGGYFIINGLERVIRLLQVPRRNHAMAIERSSFKKRGSSYSDKGVTMRCVRQDQSSVTLTLHFLNNGGATLRFALRKQEFLLPVVVVAKALANISDKELFARVVQGNNSNTFLTTRLELLLLDGQQHAVYTQSECAAFLGSHFRHFLPITDKVNDEKAGFMLIQRYLFVHTSSMDAKLDCLIHMIRKLFAFAQGDCNADNADALMNHEILLPGHLLSMYVKEKLEDIFLNVKQVALRDYRANPAKCLQDLRSSSFYQKQFDRFANSIGSKIASFLSTGNIVSSTGLDLMQVSGYTLIAERLNMFRYMSHYQSVHRGQFFTTMKTTTVRKLLPESWGFLCPVHTPDGSPCGLLNHLARHAIILSYPTHERLPPMQQARRLLSPTESSTSHTKAQPSYSDRQWLMDAALRRKLVSLGVVPSGLDAGDGKLTLSHDYISVLLDGVFVGGVHVKDASDLVRQLRMLKIAFQKDKVTPVDPTMEIAYIPRSDSKSGGYSGVYLFTQPARLIRPVLNLQCRAIEWIGPMEQVYMEIACSAKDIHALTTHIELAPTVMLSQVASLTPYSDYNQSPRNMYQCQMGKQTMGTPTHSYKHRTDNKLFRIQHTQVPLVQTEAHGEYFMDEYPQGANAVVAVISYTGEIYFISAFLIRYSYT